jgi:hypothetical protein
MYFICFVKCQKKVLSERKKKNCLRKADYIGTHVQYYEDLVNVFMLKKQNTV